MKRVLSINDVQCAARALALSIEELFLGKHSIAIYGIPRGGITAAALVANALRTKNVELCGRVNDADVIIDDLIDSGRTAEHYRSRFPHKPVLALYNKKQMDTSDWLVFPWEIGATGTDKSHEDIGIRLLELVGEDPAREGLKETPDRFVRAWQEYTRGYGHDPKEILKAFTDGAHAYSEMVLVSNIPVYSTCEHHLAAMFGVAHVAYIPDGRIVGLSKIARLVDIYARRLQVQERMTTQISSALNECLAPKGVGVVMQCRHMCMEARGATAYGSVTTTSALWGCFKEEKTRAEFLTLVEQGKNGVTI